MRAETLLPLGKLDPGLRAPDMPLDISAVESEARIADQAGYHAILMEETKDDPFQVLALAARATERVHVGTSVAIAFARSPYVTAQAAWTAQKISGGRFELGLGSQVRGHIRRRFGMDWHAAGPWMRDYVRAVKAIWQSWQTETDLAFESERYNLNLNVPLFVPAPIEHPRIPIQVAAVNPYMASVAAEVAEGVRLHPVCSPRYISEVILPAIEPHRSVGFEVCLKPLIATAPTEELLAKRVLIAKQRLAFYMSTPAYAGAFAVFGMERLCQEMAELSKIQNWDALEERVDDEVLNTCVIIALYDDLAATIKDRYGELIERIEVSLPVTTLEDQEQLSDVIKSIN
ncbi:MAG: TIGR03617 family F420-dependent LLM class oxidoreductase [Pseudomonadales bacterium]|nr:TIGR03617 family F420-dependent LLM class oxidoreductase [Pseudomonadales bacterium]